MYIVEGDSKCREVEDSVYQFHIEIWRAKEKTLDMLMIIKTLT